METEDPPTIALDDVHLCTFEDVELLGSNGMGHGEAAQARLTWDGAFKLVENGAGVALVARRDLDRSKQFWDPTVANLQDEPADAAPDRWVSVDVSSTRTGYFQLGPREGDCVQGRWAASFFIGAGGGERANARFMASVDEQGRCALGVMITKNVTTGDAILVQPTVPAAPVTTAPAEALPAMQGLDLPAKPTDWPKELGQALRAARVPCSFVSPNPKRARGNTSNSVLDYDQYMTATTVDEFFSRKGNWQHLKYDVQRGYCTLDAAQLDACWRSVRSAVVPKAARARRKRASEGNE